jgi:MFS family permease
MPRARLSPEVRLYLACGSASSLGTGLVAPFTALYIVNGIGLPRGDVAIYFGLVAVCALCCGPLAGALIDRTGVRISGLAGALLQGGSFLMLGTATGLTGLLCAAVALGVGNSLSAPSVTATLAAVVTPEDRPTAYGFRFVFYNVVMSAGAGIGALLVTVLTGETGYRILMLVNALSFVPLACYFALRGRRRIPARAGTPTGTYRSLIHNKLFIALVFLQLVVVLAGYSQLETSVTLLLGEYMGLRAGVVGIVLVFNMVAVFALNRIVRTALARWHRAVAPSVTGVAWLLAYGCGAVAAAQRTDWVTVTLAILFSILFAVGELALSSSFGPMLLDAVPADLQGRSASVIAMAGNIASLAGPAIGVSLVTATGAVPGWLLLGVGAMLTLYSAVHLRRVAAADSARRDDHLVTT